MIRKIIQLLNDIDNNHEQLPILFNLFLLDNDEIVLNKEEREFLIESQRAWLNKRTVKQVETIDEEHLSPSTIHRRKKAAGLVIPRKKNKAHKAPVYSKGLKYPTVCAHEECQKQIPEKTPNVFWDIDGKGIKNWCLGCAPEEANNLKEVKDFIHKAAIDSVFS